MIHNGEHDPTSPSFHFHRRNYTGAIVTISMLIALLFAGNLYTLDRLKAARQEEGDLRASLGKEIKDIRVQDQELLLKYILLKEAHAHQIAQLRSELDGAARQLDASTGQVLDRARTMVGAVEKQQTLHANVLEEEIAHKVDVQDVAGMMESVSGTQSQLGTTQRRLDVVTQDLGTARSELGELEASMHEQLQALQEINNREYQEFTLRKNHPIRVGQIGLRLRKTNARNQVFSLDLVANDQEIRSRDRSVFEPVFFYSDGVRDLYEVVVTAVGSGSVAGYLRIPQLAIRDEKLKPAMDRPQPVSRQNFVGLKAFDYSAGLAVRQNSDELKNQ